ncbi:hypothetical protein BP6252_10939 [Coleophoma cylindrospora]|uniref:Uncharacterized protein n=1 Tax=Coleophoma cylindrospora TaxID=1849047 RepID=A0A3D8QPL4_9HELO|nr:hypothetical protein BP6252_10939 [Coleophoma cylindrospora]
MYDSNNRLPFTKANLPSADCDKDHCNIYYVQQHGKVYRHTNVQFTNPAVNNIGRAGGTGNTAPFDGDDRLTLIHFQSTCKKGENNPDKSHNSIVKAESKYEKDSECPDILPNDIPAFFQERLKGILYSLRVPCLSKQTVSFSMVYHIRAEGGNFASATADKREERYNKEHMFGFLWGLDGVEIKELLTDLVSRWQDIADDHSKPSTGITPRLVVAALISQYGSVISETIQTVYSNLGVCDDNLNKAINDLVKNEPGRSLKSAGQIRDINENLIKMNIDLTGTRSTMHYLAESADVMVKNITTFDEYVIERLKEWHKASERTRPKKEVTDPEEPDRDLTRTRTGTFNTKLTEAVNELDYWSEKTRDNDKLVTVRKNMLQHKIDIKSLQQHININVGMVSNVISERDRLIQQSILENTARDAAKMKFMAVLTAFFLPGTFMAILLTTPMFNFLEDTKPLLTRGGIPLGIYCGVTVLGFVFLLLALFLLRKPKNRNEDESAMPKDKTSDKNKSDLGGHSNKTYGTNGESTSTDSSRQRGRKSLFAWCPNGWVPPCRESNV